MNMRGTESRQPLHTTRLLAEILLIVACAEACVLLLLPHVGRTAAPEAQVGLHVLMLALLAIPPTAWRIRQAIHPTRGASNAQPRSGAWRTWAVSVATLLAGLAFTVVATTSAIEQSSATARARFDRITQMLVAGTSERIGQTLHGLLAVRALYASSVEVTRAELQAFVASHELEREFPGAIGMGFIERVARSDVDAFIARERLDGCPEFAIHAVPDVDVPPGAEHDLYVIKHCFPRHRNASAWGLDIGSESRRRVAAEAAVSTGQATITQKIQLVQDARRQTGFLLFLPVFEKGTSPTTPEERTKTLTGLAYMPILLEEAVSGIYDSADGMLDFEIFDGAVPSAATRLYDHDGHLEHVEGTIDAGHFAGRMFRTETTLDIGSHRWTVITSTTPAFEATVRNGLPLMIALGGTAMSMLLAGIVMSLGVSHMRAVELLRAKQQAENAMRENETIFRALNGHSIVSVADTSGRIVQVNDEFCRISGYSREELVGKDHRILNSGTHPREFWQHVWQTMLSGRAWQGEVCNRTKDGSLFWVQTVMAPCRDSEGNLVNFISIRNDVTSRKQYEQKLLESAELIELKNRDLAAMAERAHRVVDDVSHEFRTPLAVIKEFSSIISDGLAGPVTEQQTKYLKIMSSAVVDLNHMVEDLLDSSKLRAGRLRVDRRPQCMKQVFTAGRTTLARKASNRCIVIEEQVEEGLPAVFADEEKVRRVISNLMTNAIKFSPENGVIELSAKRGPREGEVTVSVTDHGPGLSQEDINRLFGRFQQVSTARNVSAKGFGLGLSIAQELAWLNLGKLSVTSEKGKGATFSFTLPVNEPHAILEHYFETIGCSDRPDPTTVLLRATTEVGRGDPTEPLAFLASVTYPTDLVLPAVDEVAGAEGAEPTRAAWWVLGRTSSAEKWATRLHEARTALLGNEGVDLAPLQVDAVGSWRHPEELERARTEVIQRVAGRETMNARVLIIDDEWTIQQALQARLLANGFEVLMACDGPTGIETARTQRPDVILLDLRMPDMDGFEVLQQLRATPEAASIPVIFLTANVQDTVKQKALSAGASGFLPKPYEPTVVLEAIRRAKAHPAEPAAT